VLLGALTSYAQSWLPDPLRSLANSAGPWCAVAFALAVPMWRPWSGALAGGVSLALLVASYYVVSDLRDFAVGTSSVAFWVVAAFTAGPALGLGAVWLRCSGDLRRGWGVGVLPGVLVGEGAVSLLTVADTTWPPYWVAEVVLGVVLLVLLARGRLGTSRAVLGVTGTVVLVELAFVLVHVVDPISLV
jgi:hypothetical protein